MDVLYYKGLKSEMIVKNKLQVLYFMGVFYCVKDFGNFGGNLNGKVYFGFF